MKPIRVTVSIIVIGAVLLAAYAVGLLVRQARMSSRTSPTALDANAPARSLPRRTTQPTAEERAATREARAQKLEQSRELTEEQKAQFREQVRDRVVGRGAKSPNDANLALEELQRLSKNWENMSEEERRIFQERMQARMQRRAVPQYAPADANDNASGEPK